MLKDVMSLVLYALGSKKKDQSGLQRMSGEEIREASHLGPSDIKEALKILEADGFVKVAWSHGFDTYDFAEVWLLPKGRLEYEQRREEFYRVMKDWESSKKGLV
jgi:DNA-binding MarR family transcriptional regulator